MRVTPEEYGRIDFRTHSLLANVPLHDVWMVELPEGGFGRTIIDLRSLLSSENLTGANVAVKFLFGLRAWLGRVFRWDGEPPQASKESFLQRRSEADRACSLVAPGTLEGSFRVLFVSPKEAIS